MARNKSEKGPRRPDHMGNEGIAACIRTITKGQTFRVWYHDQLLYTAGSSSDFHIDEQYLGSEEAKAMLVGKSLEFTCTFADGDTASTDNNAHFSIEHAPLFHAIEVL